MLVPLVAVILFLALYPQLALHRSEALGRGGRGGARTPALTPRGPRLDARAGEPAAGRRT